MATPPNKIPYHYTANVENLSGFTNLKNLINYPQRLLLLLFEKNLTSKILVYFTCSLTYTFCCPYLMF